MKKQTMILTVIAAMMISAASYAQAPATNHDAKIDKAKKNYLVGLRSDISGLVESCMMRSAQVKMLYPDANYSDVKKVTDSIAVHGVSPTIRYKAYLASNVLENPEWFGKRDRQAIETPDEFFNSVAAQLQERLLGSRAN